MKKLIILLLAVAMASCSSHKKTVATQTDRLPASESNTSSPLVFPEWEIGSAVTADARTSISLDGNRYNLGGTLRMRRDDVIQLNLTYTAFITMQVATLEITGDRILLIDRINHNYVETPWDESSMFSGGNFDFNVVQSVFWGEMPDITTSQFSVVYGDYTILPDGHRLPSLVQIGINLGGKTLSINVNLSDWQVSDAWSPRTDVNQSKYTKVSVVDILRKLSAL